MLGNLYRPDGICAPPPPLATPTPPNVANCPPRIEPSLAIPILTKLIIEGRLPVSRCSSSRSQNTWTGRLYFAPTSAAVMPCLSGPNFAPNPPPTYSHFTSYLDCERPRASPIPSRTLKVPWVEAYTVALSPR